jgi:hypothetical protein
MPNNQNFDALVTLVEAESVVIDSAITLIDGLETEIRALEPTQAAIDALANKLANDKQRLAAAVATGTPTT